MIDTIKQFPKKFYNKYKIRIYRHISLIGTIGVVLLGFYLVNYYDSPLKYKIMNSLAEILKSFDPSLLQNIILAILAIFYSIFYCSFNRYFKFKKRKEKQF